MDGEVESHDIMWLAERLALEEQSANLIEVPDSIRTWNPVVRAIRDDMGRAAAAMRASRKASDRYDRWPESRRRVDNCNEAWKWRSAKDKGQRLVETAKALAFRVSLETYERALRIANTLALAADSRGYTLTHDLDLGRLVLAGHDSEIRLRISELLERKHRPRKRYDGRVTRESYLEPTGRLRISLQVGFGEGPTFQDQDTKKLDSQLNQVFLSIYRLTVKCWERTRERKAWERQREEAQMQRAEAAQRQAELEQQAAEECQRRELLLDEAKTWSSSKLIRAYVAHIHALATAVPDSPTNSEWIEWALAVAEELDPTSLRLNKRKGWEARSASDTSAAIK